MKQLVRPCPICAKTFGEVIHAQEFVTSDGYPLPSHYDFVVCARCGFCFVDTPLSQEGYDAYYTGMSKYADGATSTGAGQSPWDAARLEGMASQVADFCIDREARILDIGCANGGLVAALQKQGFYQSCGIDPSPACVEETLRGAPGCAWVGTLSALPANIGKFDGVILSHVMEHVRDLLPALERVSLILRPGGWIYIEVPDATRYEEFLVAPYQDFNTEHINHFSSKGLENLFKAASYTVCLQGVKNIYSAKDKPYPAVWCFGRKSTSAEHIEHDRLLREKLLGYVAASRMLMERIDASIAQLTLTYPEIIVWGVGQLTLKLLSDTCLGKAKIAAFVDGNPINQGKNFLGKQVMKGCLLASGNTPILVSSLINAESIVENIRALGLANPVFSLTGESL